MINLVCLAATLTFLFRAAQQSTGERNAALCGVLLSLFGLGFTSAVHFTGLMQRSFGIFLEFRGLPPAAYFSEIQADGAGLACYSLALLSLLRFLGRPANASGSAALAALGVSPALAQTSGRFALGTNVSTIFSRINSAL